MHVLFPLLFACSVLAIREDQQVAANLAASIQTAFSQEVFEGAWSLPFYAHACAQHALPELGDEGSGLTFNGDTQTFWAVSSDPVPSLHELSYPPELRHLRSMALDHDLVPDPEGVAWVGGGHLVVVCEETGNIVLVDVGAATAPTAEGDMWAAPQRPVINLGDVKHKKNDFLEGSTFDFRTQSLLVAQERKPKQLLRVGLESQTWEVLFSLEDPEPLIEAASSEEKKSDDEEKEEAALEEEDEEKKSKKKDKKKGSGHPADELLDDISAMDIAPDGSIILLSQASNKLAKLDPQGRLLESADVQLGWPEGLAFTPDGKFLVILSEGAKKSLPSEIISYTINPAFCNQ